MPSSVRTVSHPLEELEKSSWKMTSPEAEPPLGREAGESEQASARTTSEVGNHHILRDPVIGVSFVGQSALPAGFRGRGSTIHVLRPGANGPSELGGSAGTWSRSLD